MNWSQEVLVFIPFLAFVIKVAGAVQNYGNVGGGIGADDFWWKSGF